VALTRQYILTAVFLALIVVVVACSSPPAAEERHFGVVQVSAAFELDGAGKNVDSIAFWEAPDSTNTLMFVTAKDNSRVEVWRYPFVGNEQAALTHSTFASSNVNGVYVDQETDELYVTISSPANTTSVFALPSLAHRRSFAKPGADLGAEPNCGLLTRTDGKRLFYVSADKIVYVHDATTGDYLRQFRPKRGLETIVADDYAQILYIPDENKRTGVYAYDWEGRPHERHGASAFGAGTFDADAEGIVIYTCPAHGGVDVGCGFIVVSDQRPEATDFEFYDRQTWIHLGTLQILGVSNTDGTASTQQALPDYPMGLFAAINDDATTVGVGWHSIKSATGLSCPDEPTPPTAPSKR
jgi:myo-inositol-hexaphosphate 3-phosphohydrolase